MTAKLAQDRVLEVERERKNTERKLKEKLYPKMHKFLTWTISETIAKAANQGKWYTDVIIPKHFVIFENELAGMLRAMGHRVKIAHQNGGVLLCTISWSAETAL